MKPSLDQVEFDFEHGLPAGREWFTLRFVARHLDCSPRTVLRQIEEGEFGRGLANIKSDSAVKSCWRISRPALVAYLKRKGAQV